MKVTCITPLNPNVLPSVPTPWAEKVPEKTVAPLEAMFPPNQNVAWPVNIKPLGFGTNVPSLKVPGVNVKLPVAVKVRWIPPLESFVTCATALYVNVTIPAEARGQSIAATGMVIVAS